MRMMIVGTGMRAVAAKAMDFVLCSLMALLPCAIVHAAPAQQYRLAVVELRNGAKLSDDEVMYLTDLTRTQARQRLLAARFLIMTRESIVALLPPGKSLADCAKGQCEVEVGRTIGADYIVTGEVLRFGESLRLNLKVHACQSGEFLGSQSAKGLKVDDLESGIGLACAQLFSLVSSHAGVGAAPAPPAGSGAASGAVDGYLGGKPPSWNPTAKAKRVVSITSDPAGAAVLLDGQLLCASTPCRREIPIGVAQLEIQKERYTSRSDFITVPAEGPVPDVNWSLPPTFGWLTIRTTPDGLRVSANGETLGVSPVIRFESPPGSYVLRVADDRYNDVGQRVTVSIGSERAVTLTAYPKEGALQISAVDMRDNAVTGTVTVDGRALGEVPGTYKVLMGPHQVEVITNSGRWVGQVEVAEQQELPVLARVEQVERPMPAVISEDVVVRGDLMWTIQDNGQDVDWNEAREYSQACRVGGFSDWRMPTIEEVEGLYDAAQGSDVTFVAAWNQATMKWRVHIARPFRISGPWLWSSTLEGDHSAIGFGFRSGARVINTLDYRGSGRVLCVRSVKE